MFVKVTASAAKVISVLTYQLSNSCFQLKSVMNPVYHSPLLILLCCSPLLILVYNPPCLFKCALLLFSTADSNVLFTYVYSELVFGANMSRIDVDVEILYDGQKEIREVFTVHLKSRSGTAKIEVGPNRTYINIIKINNFEQKVNILISQVIS